MCFKAYEKVLSMVQNDQWVNVIHTLAGLPKEEKEELWSELVQTQVFLPDSVQDYLIQESLALTALSHRKISYDRLLQIRKESPIDYDGLIIFGSRLLKGEESTCTLERFVYDNITDELLIEKMLDLWDADFGEKKKEFLHLILRTCTSERIKKLAQRQMQITLLCTESDQEKIEEEYRKNPDPLVLLALSCNPNASLCLLKKLMKTKRVKYAKEVRVSARKNLEKRKNINM